MTYMAKKLCQWTAEVYDLANVENSSFNLNNPCRSIIKFLTKHESKQIKSVLMGSRFLRDAAKVICGRRAE